MNADDVTREQKCLALLSEALEVIQRDKLEVHFTDNWRARARRAVLNYVTDLGITLTADHEVSRVVTELFRSGADEYRLLNEAEMTRGNKKSKAAGKKGE
jgi:hypothetical protein